MPKDSFASLRRTAGEQARSHALIVPSDTQDFVDLPVSIYCNVAGTIVLRDEKGVDLPYAMIAGMWLPLRPVRALATGTSGTFYAFY